MSPEFDRYLRVQENTAEQLVLLLPTLWLCSALLSPSGAAAAGALWVAGRLAYARSYWADSRRRGPGFGVGLLAQTYLVVGAAVGAARALLA